MLKWRQIQAVAAKLTGRELTVAQDTDLDDPWRTLYRRIQPVDHPALYERELWKASVGLEDRNGLIDTVLLSLPGPGACSQFRPLDELTANLAPVTWLWPGWLPRGMLSLLGAAPGAGKSLLALDLARLVIHGQPFPDGAPARITGANVVYVDAEAVPQIQNQRAEAWGMDRSRLYLLMPPDRYGLIDFCQEEDQDRLVQMVYELQPHLVVIDSLGAVSGRGENKVEDVRDILAFLSAVAREFDLALLLIHHLRKPAKAHDLARRGGLVTADDFRGSSHIVAMARSVLALSIVQDGPRPDRNGPRRLEVVKTNLCRYPEALGVVFDEPAPSKRTAAGAACPEPDGETRGEAAPSNAWDTVPVLHYTAAPTPYREPTQADACADWLLETLRQAGEAMRPKEILALAREVGFAQGVVYRARRRLAGQIVDTETHRSPRNQWALAGWQPEVRTRIGTDSHRCG
jgi:hypothetical protein